MHHHFEISGWSETKIILRFWIVAAVGAAIGFTIYQQSRGVSASRRPPLPPGPWLVVGHGPLRRRGAAGARGAAGGGAGVDAARRGRPRHRRGPDTHGWRCSSGVARGGRSRPACRARRRSSPRRCERGIPVLGELELAWRLLAERVRRGHRHQRQDDDGRADRPHPPRGGPAGRGRRQRRHRAELARRRAATPRRRSSARPRRSSSRTRPPSRPRARCC